MKTPPLGTASIWTGVGTAGAFVVGVTASSETAPPLRLLGAALIVAGIAMMKLSSRH